MVWRAEADFTASHGRVFRASAHQGMLFSTKTSCTQQRLRMQAVAAQTCRCSHQGAMQKRAAAVASDAAVSRFSCATLRLCAHCGPPRTAARRTFATNSTDVFNVVRTPVLADMIVPHCTRFRLAGNVAHCMMLPNNVSAALSFVCLLPKSDETHCPRHAAASQHNAT